jgi:hypothetical protein
MMMSDVEVVEEVKEVKEVEESWEGSDTMDSASIVDGLLKLVSGFSAKFNREQGLAVVDLKHRQEAQGTRFRQLFVSQKNGVIAISLVESFKSAHGGNEQRKTLQGFVVSVSDIEQYGRLERRFFNYDPSKNVTQGKLLLDELETTVR